MNARNSVYYNSHMSCNSVQIINLQTVPAVNACTLIFRPFPPPVFDRLQYAKMEGEGLEERVTCVTSGRHESRCEGG